MGACALDQHWHIGKCGQCTAHVQSLHTQRARAPLTVPYTQTFPSRALTEVLALDSTAHVPTCTHGKEEDCQAGQVGMNHLLAQVR